MPRSVKYSLYIIPADMRHLSNVGSMRGRRRRRRPSIEPTLGKCLIFAHRRRPSIEPALIQRVFFSRNVLFMVEDH